MGGLVTTLFKSGIAKQPTRHPHTGMSETITDSKKVKCLHQFFKFNGHQVPFTIIYPKDGADMVILHCAGFMSHSSDADGGFCEDLIKNFETAKLNVAHVIFDYPKGAKDILSASVTISLIINYLQFVGIKREQIVLWGHSLGAMLALRATLVTQKLATQESTQAPWPSIILDRTFDELNGATRQCIELNLGCTVRKSGPGTCVSRINNFTFGTNGSPLENNLDMWLKIPPKKRLALSAIQDGVIGEATLHNALTANYTTPPHHYQSSYLLMPEPRPGIKVHNAHVENLLFANPGNATITGYNLIKGFILQTYLLADKSVVPRVDIAALQPEPQPHFTCFNVNEHAAEIQASFNGSTTQMPPMGSPLTEQELSAIANPDDDPATTQRTDLGHDSQSAAHSTSMSIAIADKTVTTNESKSTVHSIGVSRSDLTTMAVVHERSTSLFNEHQLPPAELDTPIVQPQEPKKFIARSTLRRLTVDNKTRYKSAANKKWIPVHEFCETHGLALTEKVRRSSPEASRDDAPRPMTLLRRSKAEEEGRREERKQRRAALKKWKELAKNDKRLGDLIVAVGDSKYKEKDIVPRRKKR